MKVSGSSAASVFGQGAAAKPAAGGFGAIFAKLTDGSAEAGGVKDVLAKLANGSLDASAAKAALTKLASEPEGPHPAFDAAEMLAKGALTPEAANEILATLASEAPAELNAQATEVLSRVADGSISVVAAREKLAPNSNDAEANAHLTGILTSLANGSSTLATAKQNLEPVALSLSKRTEAPALRDPVALSLSKRTEAQPDDPPALSLSKRTAAQPDDPPAPDAALAAILNGVASKPTAPSTLASTSSEVAPEHLTFGDEATPPMASPRNGLDDVPGLAAILKALAIGPAGRAEPIEGSPAIDGAALFEPLASPHANAAFDAALSSILSALASLQAPQSPAINVTPSEAPKSAKAPSPAGAVTPQPANESHTIDTGELKTSGAVFTALSSTQATVGIDPAALKAGLAAILKVVALRSPVPSGGDPAAVAPNPANAPATALATALKAIVAHQSHAIDTGASKTGARPPGRESKPSNVDAAPPTLASAFNASEQANESESLDTAALKAGAVHHSAPSNVLDAKATALASALMAVVSQQPLGSHSIETGELKAGAILQGGTPQPAQVGGDEAPLKAPALASALKAVASQLPNGAHRIDTGELKASGAALKAVAPQLQNRAHNLDVGDLKASGPALEAVARQLARKLDVGDLKASGATLEAAVSQLPNGAHGIDTGELKTSGPVLNAVPANPPHVGVDAISQRAPALASVLRALASQRANRSIGIDPPTTRNALAAEPEPAKASKSVDVDAPEAATLNATLAAQRAPWALSVGAKSAKSPSSGPFVAEPKASPDRSADDPTKVAAGLEALTPPAVNGPTESAIGGFHAARPTPSVAVVREDRVEVGVSTPAARSMYSPEFDADGHLTKTHHRIAFAERSPAQSSLPETPGEAARPAPSPSFSARVTEAYAGTATPTPTRVAPKKPRVEASSSLETVDSKSTPVPQLVVAPVTKLSTPEPVAALFSGRSTPHHVAPASVRPTLVAAPDRPPVDPAPVAAQATPNDALAQRALSASLTVSRPDTGIDTDRKELKPTKQHAEPVKVVGSAPAPSLLEQLAAAAAVAAPSKPLLVSSPHADTATPSDERTTRPVEAAKKPKVDADPSKPFEQLASVTPQPLPAPVETRPLDAPAPFAAPAVPIQPASAAVLEDPSLRVVLLPQIARVSIETADAGRVSIQVKVNDGVAEVSASGPAASLVEARQGELKVALAKEGLAMGSFDMTQSQSQGRQQQHTQAEERFSQRQPLVNPMAPPSAVSRSTRNESPTKSGFHVKA